MVLIQSRFKSVSVVLLFSFMMASFFVSCDKKAGCYDEDLYQAHKDDVCTMDCPGVTGCDGEFYCNECIALTQGISVD